MSGSLTGREAAAAPATAEAGLPARVGVVGAGVIGAAWTARFALCGADVVVADPSPAAKGHVESTLAAARTAWRRLGLLPDVQPSTDWPSTDRSGDDRSGDDRSGAVAMGGEPGRLSGGRFVPGTAGSVGTVGSEGTVTVVPPGRGMAPALEGAELICECVPERMGLKRTVYADIEETAAPDAIIASSTSGLRPSDLQADMVHPERLIVGHPFNPVYLLPLVEVVAGRRTGERAVERAMGWFSAAGMSPLRVRTEIDGFVADRLLEALWREALWLVHDGIATVAEIDDAMRLGFGLRWAQMGVFGTYATAGGEGGFRHFVEHFAPTLSLPWTKLIDVPEMSPAFMRTLVEQADELAAGRSAEELCAARDRNLVDILLALEANEWGAGRCVAALRQQLASRS